MANPIGATGATNPAVQTTSTSSPSQTLGKDDFLKLLVAQMRFQNPMSPTDPTQFMAQTAQFTMIEKLQNMEQSSSDALKAQQSTEAAAMLGQQVVATGPDGNDVTGIVTGMRITSTGPQLKVGALEIGLDAVKEVDRPTTTSPTTTAPTTTTTTTPSTDPTTPAV